MSFHAINRRTFVKTAGTAAAVSLLPSRFLWAAGQHKINNIGVQLYTVRGLMKDDFEGTIAKVAQIGYKEVEFAGYFGRTADQVRGVGREHKLFSKSLCLETHFWQSRPESGARMTMCWERPAGCCRPRRCRARSWRECWPYPCRPGCQPRPPASHDHS